MGLKLFGFSPKGRVWDESLTATNIQQLTHQSQVKLKKDEKRHKAAEFFNKINT